MTEAAWLVCEDANGMLVFLRGNASQRKLRFFAVACCRAILDWTTDERSRRALIVAERFADGLTTQSERREAYRQLRSYADDFAPDECVASVVHRHAFIAAAGVANWSSVAVGAAADYASSAEDRLPDIVQARVSERKRQSHLLREIFGNPFRPVAFAPAWRTSDVLLLARGIYEEKAFDRMPILADALQDAGCDNDDILNHCRDASQVHVRGCWVVDLVLGKE